MAGRVFVAGPASWNQIVMLDALPEPVPHMQFARSHRWAVGGTSAGKALNLRSLGVAVTLRTVVGNLADAVNATRALTLVPHVRSRARPLAPIRAEMPGSPHTNATGISGR